MKQSGTTFNRYNNKPRDPCKLTKKEQERKDREYAPVTVMSGEEYMKLKAKGNQ